MRHQLISIFVTLLFRSFTFGQFIGDECIRDYDNRAGICRPDSECKQAQDEYNKKGIPLTECSFLSGQLIICCPEKPNRISAQKCEEYRKLTTKQILVWPLINAETNGTGIEVQNCDNSTPLITGGKVTKTGEFPHMAAIGWRKSREPSFECGGSLISERFVLTAAHCYISDGIKPSFVRLGDQNLRSKEDLVQEIDIDIMDFIKHPLYSARTDKNDIALIKLVHTVSFSKSIRPACLWQSNNFNFTQVIATGWGATEYGSKTSDELMKVELELFENNNCNQLLEYSISLTSERFLDERQVCSGIMKGGMDTCQGDSGGPLQVSFNGSTCLYHIIGVTSFGSSLCGTPNTPAVYSRVSAYLDWIEDIVWK